MTLQILLLYYKIESIRNVKCIANIVNFRFADKL